MMFTSILTAAALATAPALAIPPPIFGFPDSGNHTELGVSYTLNGNATMVKEAMLFGGNITQAQPVLTLDPAMYQSVADYNGKYMVIMVDPDASTPEQPNLRFILHWMATDIGQSEGANGLRQLSPPSVAAAGTDFVPYRAPGPGATSSAHRYIIYAFQQPADFTVPARFAGLAGGQNRTSFNLTDFMDAAGLVRPAAAEYFYVSKKTDVPGGFVALPGGTYPGGNGGAIFENSPNAAGNQTGGSGGSGSGGSGSGTSSSGGGKSGAVSLDPRPGWVDGLWALVLGLAAVL